MKKFKFLGTEIIIKKERAMYNDMRLKYESIALKAKENFEYIYSNQNDDLDDVINNSNLQWGNIFSKEINVIIEKLVKEGFYHVSPENFVRQYCEGAVQVWENAYKRIEDVYVRIIFNQEQQEEYRRLRKSSRGQWIGGGFGLQGALKGAMQAEALNVGSGLIHSVANQFGNLHSNYQTSKNKRTVFNDSSTLEELSWGVYVSVLKIGYAYIDFLEENSNLRFDGVYQEDSEKAATILSNIKRVNIDRNEKIKLFKEIINLNYS